MLRTSTIPKTFLCAALALSACGDDGGAEATGETTETSSSESSEATGTEATSSSSEASTEATGDGDGDATSGDGDGDATGDGDGDGDGTSGDGDGDGLVHFRMDTIEVQDPHFYTDLLGPCLDVTDPGGIFAVNDLIADAIETDGSDPADDILDLSLVYGLNPGNSSVAGGDSEAGLAECNIDGSPCNWGTFGPPQTSTFTNETTGECVSLAEFDADYSPITTPGPTCFTSSIDTFTLNLGGISIPLSDVTIAATWSGSTQTDGVLKGFLTEAAAANTQLPSSLPMLGGQPVSVLLAGGSGCQVDAGNPIDDTEMHNGESGWWFFVNFTSEIVPEVTL